MLLPGGFEESTITSYDYDKVYIKERKGFIKNALKYGYIVHPCYTFNENKLFYTLNWFEDFRVWLNKFKIPIPLFLSKNILWPRQDLDILIVIGKGIKLPKLDEISSETLDTYHNLYMKELCELFDRHKGIGILNLFNQTLKSSNQFKV